MKILVYGLQSSGASLFTFLAAQKPRTIAIPDLYNRVLAPDIPYTKNVDHILIKTTLGFDVPLENLLEQFKPDKTVLIIRHPFHNFASLKTKFYCAQGGAIEEKFNELERIFCEKKFDLIISYENIIVKPLQLVELLRTIGFELQPDFLDIKRKKEDIAEFNNANSVWCREHYMKDWEFGNIDSASLPVDKEKIIKKTNWLERFLLAKLCPNVVRFSETGVLPDRCQLHGRKFQGKVWEWTLRLYNFCCRVRAWIIRKVGLDLTA